jgi:hypothetical protein
METRLMRILGIIAGVVILIAGSAWLAVTIAYPDYVYRYRLTVELEDDGKIKTGSGVMEIHNQTQPKFAGIPVFARGIGDAIFIDLGAKGHIIATLAFGPKGTIPDRLETLVPKTFGLTFNDLGRLSTLSGSQELTGEDVPTLVTFADLNDFGSARIVRPEELPKVLGEGVRFHRAYLEITRDPVTRGIEAKLPWLPHPGYLNGTVCNPAEPHCLHGGDFTR